MAKDWKLLIGNEFRKTGQTLEVTNPFDGSVVGVTYLASRFDLEDALSAASAAFETLKGYPAYKRAEIIGKVADGISAREEEFARLIALEAGKPIRDARAEARRAAGTFQIALEEAKRMEGSLIPLDIYPGSEGRMCLIKRFPVGVVLGITPFNFPLNLVAHKIAPAMACGNPIIIKPALKTPLSALLLGEIITEAGWPAGGVNVVVCSNVEAERLLDDARIKKLTFTGSAAVGWMLKAKAGSRKVTLELGGNAGVIIHNDADIGYAASRCAAGAFAYAGQVCISVQRIYVQREIFDAFTKGFLERCRALKSGNPLDETTDIGPMIDAAAAARAEQWVKEAVAGGAKLLTGGKRNGSFFEPTVLTGTRPSMKVSGEEVFAPVVIIEPYDTFEEAVIEVNRGLYGLQAGVFTRDMERIFYAYERLVCGGVIVNDVPTYRVDNMPYGGVKQSGFGREGIRYAIEEMTEMRLLALKMS